MSVWLTLFILFFLGLTIFLIWKLSKGIDIKSIALLAPVLTAIFVILGFVVNSYMSSINHYHEQIRQDSNKLTQKFKEIHSWLLEHPEYAGTLMNELQETEWVSKTPHPELVAFYEPIVILFQSCYYLVTHRDVPFWSSKMKRYNQDINKWLDYKIKHWFTRPSLEKYWSENKHQFTRSFIEYVDLLLQKKE